MFLFHLICCLLLISKVLSQSVPTGEPTEMPPLFDNYPLPPLQLSPDNRYDISSQTEAKSYPTDRPFDAMSTATVVNLNWRPTPMPFSPSSVTLAPTESHSMSTPMTPYELYRNTWCKAMINPSAPHMIPDSMEVTQFLDKFVVPEYRSLWYRSCYLPHRSAGIAFNLFNRGLSLANEALRGVINNTNVVATLGSSGQVIRDLVANRLPTKAATSWGLGLKLVLSFYYLSNLYAFRSPKSLIVWINVSLITWMRSMIPISALSGLTRRWLSTIVDYRKSPIMLEIFQ